MSAPKPAGAKTRDIKPFGLRMLPELKKLVEERATANGVSLNTQIAMELEEFPDFEMERKLARKEAETLRSAIDTLKAEIAERDRIIEKLEQRVDELSEAGQATVERLSAETERVSLLTHQRIPEGLYNRITRIARIHLRPVEEEVVQALEKAFPLRETTDELLKVFELMAKPLDRLSAKYLEDNPPVAAHVQKISDHLERIRDARGTPDEERILEEFFKAFPGFSR